MCTRLANYLHTEYWSNMYASRAPRMLCGLEEKTYKLVLQDITSSHHPLLYVELSITLWSMLLQSVRDVIIIMIIIIIPDQTYEEIFRKKCHLQMLRCTMRHPATTH